jgi:hypothetical protein
MSLLSNPFFLNAPIVQQQLKGGTLRGRRGDRGRGGSILIVSIPSIVFIGRLSHGHY